MQRAPPLECHEGDAGEQAGPGPGKGFYLSPPHWGLPCLWTDMTAGVTCLMSALP